MRRQTSTAHALQGIMGVGDIGKATGSSFPGRRILKTMKVSTGFFKKQVFVLATEVSWLMASQPTPLTYLPARGLLTISFP